MKTKMSEQTPIHEVLFSYQTTYKVGIGHTPFQLTYGLHPLLLT